MTGSRHIRLGFEGNLLTSNYNYTDVLMIYMVTYEYIKEVYVTRKTYWDYLGTGDFNMEQEELLLALMDEAMKQELFVGGKVNRRRYRVEKWLYAIK